MEFALGLSLTSAALMGGAAWSPAALFDGGLPGHWPGGYDPAAGRIWQDAAGTTPTTTFGQPVGLVLDQSQGLVLGPELFTDQPSIIDNSGGGATVVHTASTRTVQVTAAGVNTSYPRLQVSVGATVGKRYAVSGRIDGGRTNVNLVRFALSGPDNNFTYDPQTGVFRGKQVAGTSPVIEIHMNGTQLGTVTIAELSVRELPGNHASQATALSRPTLARWPKGGRRNLLTFAGAWSTVRSKYTPNVAIAPDGTMTAGKLVDSTDNNSHSITKLSNTPAIGFFNGSIHLKKAELRYAYLRLIGSANGTPKRGDCVIDLDTGVITGQVGEVFNVAVTPSSEGFYRVSAACPQSDTTRADIQLFTWIDPTVPSNPIYEGTGTSGFYVWGEQLEAGSTVTPYQKVTTANDVTEAGVPDVWHLSNDGGDSLPVPLPAGLYGRAWVDAAGLVTVDTVTDPTNALIPTAVNSTQADVILRQGAFTADEEASIRSYWAERYAA